MKLYQVVLKDVMRRRKRVLYATLGVVIGTMTVVGIMTIARAGEQRIYSQLEKYGANLTVVPATKNLNVSLGNLNMGTMTIGENYIFEDNVPKIRQIADSEIKKALGITDPYNIATVAPRLFLLHGVKGTQVMLVGIDPAEEKQLKTWWKVGEGGYFQEDSDALVGKMSAEVLGLGLGNRIAVNGINITVTGILDETGSNDDYQIFLPLKTLQKAFNKEGLISSVDVRALCNACPVDIIADAVNQNIAGVRAVAVKQVADTEMGMVERINRFMLALSGITLLVGIFGVVNTLMASVHERMKDIGIMRAVGASRNQVIRILIYEAIIIGILGGLLGYGVGSLLARAVGPLIFEGSTVTLVPQYLGLSLGVALFIAIVATLYPAVRASKIRVADSFRSL